MRVNTVWNWKLLRFSLMHFWQKFRERNVFTIEITKEMIWRNIFLVRLHFSKLHSVVISEISPHCKIFSSNWYTVKKSIWRKFCKKSWRKNLQISTLFTVTLHCDYVITFFYAASFRKKFVKAENPCIAQYSTKIHWFHEVFAMQKIVSETMYTF